MTSLCGDRADDYDDKMERKPRHVVFLHLDLGIGGAEQLMINLACASGCEVSIYTTHCSPTHCFGEVRPPSGVLYSSLRVCGSFLPVTIFGGYGTALCSTIRMLYLTYRALRENNNVDLFVVDVLPTGLPLLARLANDDSGVLFYCHFPDKLLTRDTINGQPILPAMTSRGRSLFQIFKRMYRHVLDKMEEYTMQYADLICVNSNFTKQQVLHTFPNLSTAPHRTASDGYIQVLYPAIDLTKFIPPNLEQKRRILLHSKGQQPATIVSLNRFERKKNLELLLHAYATLLRKNKQQQHTFVLPKLIIAGGYDPRNAENVSYLSFLQSLATQLSLTNDLISFRPSISDSERATLLQSALCVAYTPYREHFGIVPIEAMYAGSAVIAMNSGGPMETIQDGITGLLVDYDDNDNDEHGLETRFADALYTLLSQPEKAIDMGIRGHDHVKTNFGLDNFRTNWERIMKETIQRGEDRRHRKHRVFTISHLRNVLFAIVAVWMVTTLWRTIGVVV